MIEKLNAPKGGKRSELAATRVTPRLKAGIVALARSEDCTVTDLIYHLVVPTVEEFLEQRGDAEVSE